MRISKARIMKAILLYNKYKSPEAHAKLIGFEGRRIIVRFDGIFCETCGVNDWIEDFKYVLEDLNISAELRKSTNR